jgi:hypothetical protein
MRPNLYQWIHVSFFAILALGVWGVVGCAHHRLPPAAVDPVLTWDAVTTACDGVPLTGPVTYNVYAVAGPGPIPTALSPDASPCGPVELATGTPLNAAPLTGTTYTAAVGDGVWTFGVEAVLASGARSGVSASVTRTVVNRGTPPANPKVTK